MRNNRKWLVLLLAMVLLVNTLGVSASAAENGSPLALYVSPAAEPGSTVQVHVVATEANVNDGKLVVTYDAEKLTYVGTERGVIWPEDGMNTLSVNPSDGKVIVAFAMAEPAIRGIVCTLSFTAGAEGTASVKLDGSSYITGVDADLSQEASTTITEDCVSITVKAGDHGWCANSEFEMTIQAAAGSTITAGDLPPILPKTGYALSGWMTPDGTVIALDELNVTAEEGLTLTAQYTFICGGGEDCPSSRFVDVANLSNEAHEAVDFMVGRSYMNGMSATMFGPNGDLNRAMMVTILYRMAGQPAVDGTPAFTDVPEGTFYTDAVVWAAENGITNGVSASLFAPGKSLSRQELVTFLHRFTAKQGMDVSASADLSGYTDADVIRPYARPAFEWAVANGIIKGVTETTLEPEATTTRAQVALMVYRMLSNLD